MRGDEFRSVTDVFRADVRQEMDGRTIVDHHARVPLYELDENVPESIKTQYEVARNLYLHAWAVYRFYMVAQHQALIVLEFSIKEKFGKRTLNAFAKAQGLRPALAAYIRFLAQHEHISNADFEVWWHRRRTHAEQRHMRDVMTL